MILYRPSTFLHLCKLSPSSSSPKLLSQFRHSYSFLSDTLSTSSSFSTSLRVRWVSVNKPRNGQIRAFGSGGDTFYSEESVSWASLGLSDKLSRALVNVGLGQPSLVQASCIPTILSGKDVVVAAETGSGKTHGYLVPLFNSLCSAQEDSVNSESESQRGPGSARQLSLVLCPNVTLCEQVVRMANSLCGEDGQPLLVVSSVCGRQGWPVNRPDIIVSTPGALLNNIELNDRRRLGFLRVVKYIVFDEADMLLSGGFENKVIRLIHMLRFDEKQLSRSKTSSPESSTSSELETATSAGYDFEENGEEEEEEEDDKNTEFDAVSDDEEESFDGATEEVTDQKRTDWRRARKIYERSKQYIFVAATLPLNGKKTAGAVLKRMFPEATWVSGNYLHRHNPRLKQRWVEVSVETQVDELLKAVNEDSGAKSAASNKRTIVFANTVEAVEAVAKILANAKIECYRYHKDCKLEERAETLSLFQEKGGVLVCTDAASRGVDIQNISHVIQADFATSAVDFLHRVGRTARAGQYGCVTNFYTYANKDLVAAVRRAAELGQSVETAFSRKRGFRNKIKKQGRGNVTNKSTVVVS